MMSSPLLSEVPPVDFLRSSRPPASQQTPLIKQHSIRTPFNRSSKQSRLHGSASASTSVDQNEAHPNLRKTRMCPHVSSATRCPLTSDECRFAHGPEELRVSIDRFYKVSPCAFYDRGKCRNGDLCRFAHGEHELRTHQVNNSAATSQQPTQTSSNAGGSTPMIAPVTNESPTLQYSSLDTIHSAEPHQRPPSPGPMSSASSGEGGGSRRDRTNNPKPSNVALFLSAQHQRRLGGSKRTQLPPRIGGRRRTELMDLDSEKSGYLATPPGKSTAGESTDALMTGSEAESGVYLEHKLSVRSFVSGSDDTTPSTAIPSQYGRSIRGGSSRSSVSDAPTPENVAGASWLLLTQHPTAHLPLCMLEQCRSIAVNSPALLADAERLVMTTAYAD